MGVPQLVYPFQGGHLAIMPPPRGARSLLAAVVTATGLALAIALLWPSAARANTLPSPDPSPQILPDAAPVKGQPQSPDGSSSGPQAAGEVTPAAPTPVAPTHAPAGSAKAGTASAHAAVRPAAGRDLRSPARHRAGRQAVRRPRHADQVSAGSPRPSPLFRSPLSPAWEVGQAGSSHHGAGAAWPLAALAVLLLVVAAGSLFRLYAEPARGRPV
jgi:hypothetical protein